MNKLLSTNHQNKQTLETACPMIHALSKIGNRWKPLILSRLTERNLRFTQLASELPIITRRMLTLSLRELERDKLIQREDHGGYPKNVSYSLTNSGRELKPVLLGICEWGTKDMLGRPIR